MTTITIDKFNTTTVNEWGEAFGLIALVPDTTAYELVTDEHVFAIGYSADDDMWVCEIDDLDGGCEACYQGSTPERALENASVEAVSTLALRENDNCEDAVNQMGYTAFGMLSGCEFPDTREDYERLDRMMALATRFVKARGPFYDIKWEPYQVCEA